MLQPIEVGSREFEGDPDRVRRLANEGPVLIADQGVCTHVIMSMKHYESLKARATTLPEALAQTGSGAEIKFDPPRIRIEARDVDID